MKGSSRSSSFLSCSSWSSLPYFLPLRQWRRAWHVLVASRAGGAAALTPQTGSGAARLGRRRQGAEARGARRRPSPSWCAHPTKASRTSSLGGKLCPLSLHSTRPAAVATKWGACLSRKAVTAGSMSMSLIYACTPAESRQPPGGAGGARGNYRGLVEVPPRGAARGAAGATPWRTSSFCPALALIGTECWVPTHWVQPCRPCGRTSPSRRPCAASPLP